MKKRIELYMAVLLLVAVCLLSKKGAVLVSSMRAAEEKPCIVVDAGHGGDDPGKIGIHGELEKDINLAIAKKVKARLEKENITVILTRETDESLDKGESGSKKVADMRNRCRLIDESKPLFTISVHQNSYTEEAIKGAQCFYFGQSEEGKKIAETMQESLRSHLDTENKREAKANESYYLLKKTAYPTVIVECGFLSNSEEAAKLSTEEYQEAVAEAIADGILNCMGNETADTEDVVNTEKMQSQENQKTKQNGNATE
ncbi:N-acetylmuramoyl-L-alanine amidase [Thermoguttaceae bacterium LCP21S3_D4]|nr:N-acetylmuramoyl-L-alanine amidase [Lachnospiraceae bacterium]MDD6303296.1 N-acetylmuramoyl-L-alanine amidase [Lachnospiraceae bacterium]